MYEALIHYLDSWTFVPLCYKEGKVGYSSQKTVCTNSAFHLVNGITKDNPEKLLWTALFKNMDPSPGSMHVYTATERLVWEGPFWKMSNLVQNLGPLLFLKSKTFCFFFFFFLGMGLNGMNHILWQERRSLPMLVQPLPLAYTGSRSCYSARTVH